MKIRMLLLSGFLNHCTEMHFSSFFSGGFITAIVVNQQERKLAKHTSVHCNGAEGTFDSGDFSANMETSARQRGDTVLRFDVKVAFFAKLRLKIMTFLSHMPSPMLVYALNTI